MTYRFDGFNYLIRLTKGERLSTALETFAQETSIEGAWVSGLGGVLEVTLGFYDLEKKSYQWKTFNGLREMASLAGNMAFDESGKLVLHLHGVLSDASYQTIGGHIKDAVAAATIELFVHRAYQPTKRVFDADTGLRLLDL